MNKNLEGMLLPIGIMAGSTVILLLIRSILFRFVGKWAKQSEIDVSQTFVNLIRTPSFAVCVATGVYIGVAFSGLSPKLARQFYQAIHVILILSFTLAVANLASGAFRHVMLVGNRSGIGNGKTTGLATVVVKGAVVTVGVGIILSVLGISIAPVLTALGVGGLAVALALRDTLENLFAGIYLITDRAIQVGDYVKLESGQEGAIEDIGWRTTKVSLLNNNTVIMPNTKLAQSVLTNYSVPDDRFPVKLAVPVHQDADIDKAESIILQVAKRASEDVVGVLTIPDPVVRLSPGFTAEGLEFTLHFYVKDFTLQTFALHELRKRIIKEFRKEGVALPDRPSVPAPAKA